MYTAKVFLAAISSTFLLGGVLAINGDGKFSLHC
jgi:hypothetical protein